jgi:pimeloyl-ACP methyl ester carboxylesterase
MEPSSLGINVSELPGRSAARLPNSELISYPDSGHGAVFQFHEALVPKALAFLAR